jgi:Protein kinase domain
VGATERIRRQGTYDWRVDLPDPVTEQWIDASAGGLSDQAVTEAVARLRARGGEQAMLGERLLRLRGGVASGRGETSGSVGATESDETVPRAGRMDDLVGGGRFAGYVIEGVAGRGGMGVVYRARQVRPSRVVGLKVISPDLAGDGGFRERFVDESEIAASIEHSNVIPVYEVGEDAGRLFIAMRFVQGTDLGRVIAAEGPVAPERAVGIVAQLTSALDAAHARGLVHRDVKPANVLIAREGDGDHVYLTDFGLAKFAVGGGVTRTGMFVGTLDYAAPEQFEGRRVDARTDVYAAGCVLYNMLTGSVPFPRQDEAAVMWAHMSSGPPSVRELVPSLPREFDAVIARAMAKDPEQRYQSAGDLGRDARAAAQRQHASLSERSVATGRAAPSALAAAAAAGTVPDTAAPAGTVPDTAADAAAGGTGAGAGAPTVADTAAGAAAGAAAGGAGAGAAAGVAGAGGGAASPPVRAPADRPGRPRSRGLIAALGAGTLVVIAAVALLASGAFSGSSASHSTGTGAVTPPATTPATTPTTATAPTTKTFTDLKHGISFAYPASWQPRTLGGSTAAAFVVTDFGTGTGAGATYCALIFLPNAKGPANSSQPARFAFVRARAFIGDTKPYKVLSIQADPGANITGVGYIATAGSEGEHISFFFSGRNIYAFQCITPAAQLSQVQQQTFQPLLSSVQIG